MHSLSKATQNLQAAVQLANKTAAEIAETYFIGSEHFIYAFLNMPKCEACKILTRAGVKKEKYEQLFLQNVDKKYQGRGLTPNTQKMFDRAVESAMHNAGTLILKHHLNHCVKEGVKNGDGDILDRFNKVLESYL